MATAAAPSKTKEDRTKTYEQVVAAINSTKSFKLAADKLNADKVPTLGKTKTGDWTPDTVRSTGFRSGMEFKTTSLHVKDGKVVGKTLKKDQPPGEVVKLPSASSSGTSGKRSTTKRSGAKKQTAAAASKTSGKRSSKSSGSKRGGK